MMVCTRVNVTQCRICRSEMYGPITPQAILRAMGAMQASPIA